MHSVLRRQLWDKAFASIPLRSVQLTGIIPKGKRLVNQFLERPEFWRGVYALADFSLQATRSTAGTRVSTGGRTAHR
jgi:hypothetical protein